MIGTHVDISERRRVEEDLRASEERYRDLFNSMVDGFALHEIILDAQGHPCDYRFLAVNPAFEDMTGWKARDVVGKRIREIAPQIEAHWIDTYGAVALTGTPTHFENFSAAQNKFFDVIAYRPAPGQFACVFNDITARKVAEDRLQRTSEELRRLSMHLQTIREIEATRMSQRIHDDFGQALTSLKMDLSWINRRLGDGQDNLKEKIAGMCRIIDASTRSIQNFSTELRPTILTDMGLAAAIEWQVKRFRENTETPCELSLEPPGWNPPNAETGTLLFRIFQEALTNIARHAQASKVEVALRVAQGRAILSIRDNGRGIPAEKMADTDSFGLIQMRERAIAGGGDLIIETAPHAGTHIQATLPV